MKEQKKKRSKKKIIITIVIVIVVLLLALLIAGGNYLVSFALKSDFEIPNIQPDTTLTEEEFDEVVDSFIAENDEAKLWLEAAETRDVSVIAEDGITLYGMEVYPEKASHKWLICLHGYRGRSMDILPIAYAYAGEDFNILLPDLRGCGKSEGEYLGMGWTDRKDMLKWIELIIAEDPDAEIALHGVSMGGATVMMTAGEELPSNVKVAVEDCGYTSVWDIFSDEIGYVFNIPSFPLLHFSSVISKMRVGYAFSEASSVEQLKHANIPVLFIHGSQDSFVHTEMVYKVYDACSSEKDILVVDGADHGMSNYIAPELYFEKCFDFVSKYMGSK